MTTERFYSAGTFLKDWNPQRWLVRSGHTCRSAWAGSMAKRRARAATPSPVLRFRYKYVQNPHIPTLRALRIPGIELWGQLVRGCLLYPTSAVFPGSRKIYDVTIRLILGFLSLSFVSGYRSAPAVGPTLLLGCFVRGCGTDLL